MKCERTFVMYAVGLKPQNQTHILSAIYRQLGTKVSIVVNSSSSASACTDVVLSKTQRINKERRQVALGRKVYEVVDELRMNNVVSVADVRQYLSNVRSSIKVVETYIEIRQYAEFRKLRNAQSSTMTEIHELVNKRSKYMDKVEQYKSTILSILFKEILLVDKLSALDIQIDQFCMQFGVSGGPFAEAGKLVSKVWGVVTRSLFVELGKD